MLFNQQFLQMRSSTPLQLSLFRHIFHDYKLNIIFFIIVFLSHVSRAQDCPDVPEGETYVDTVFQTYPMPINDYNLYAVGHSRYHTCIPKREMFSFTFPQDYIDMNFDAFTVCLSAQIQAIPLFTKCFRTTKEEVQPNGNPTTNYNKSNNNDANKTFALVARLVHEWQSIDTSTREISWTLKISPVNHGTMESLQNFDSKFHYEQGHPTISSIVFSSILPFAATRVLSSDIKVYPIMIDLEDKTAVFTINMNNIKIDAQSISFSYIGDGCLQLDTKYQKLLALFPNYRDTLGSENDVVKVGNVNDSAPFGENVNESFDTTFDKIDDQLNPPYSCAHPHQSNLSPTSPPTSPPTPRRIKCLINGHLVFGSLSTNNSQLYTPRITIDYDFRSQLDYTITCVHIFLFRNTRISVSLESYTPLDVFQFSLQPVPSATHSQRIDAQAQDTSLYSALVALKTTQNTPFSDFTSSHQYKPALIGAVVSSLASSDHSLYIQLSLSLSQISPSDTLSCRFNDGSKHTQTSPINLGPLLLNVTSIEPSFVELYSTVIDPVRFHPDGGTTIHPYGEFEFKFIRFKTFPPISASTSLTITIQSMTSLLDLDIDEYIQMSCLFIHDSQVQLSSSSNKKKDHNEERDPEFTTNNGDNNVTPTLRTFPQQQLPHQFNTADLPTEIYNPIHIIPITVDTIAIDILSKVSLRIFLPENMEPDPETDSEIPIIPSLLQNSHTHSHNHNSQNSILATTNNFYDINPGRISFILTLSNPLQSFFTSFSMYLLGNHRFGGGWVCYLWDEQKKTKTSLVGTANIHDSVNQPSITNRDIFHKSLPVLSSKLSVITFQNIALSEPEDPQQVQNYVLRCPDGFILADDVSKFYSPSYFHLEAESPSPTFNAIIKSAFGATFRPPQMWDEKIPNVISNVFQTFAYCASAFVFLVAIGILSLRAYLRCTQKIALEKLELQAQNNQPVDHNSLFNQFHPSNPQAGQTPLRNNTKKPLKLGPQQLLLDDEQISSLL